MEHLGIGPFLIRLWIGGRKEARGLPPILMRNWLIFSLIFQDFPYFLPGDCLPTGLLYLEGAELTLIFAIQQTQNKDMAGSEVKVSRDSTTYFLA